MEQLKKLFEKLMLGTVSRGLLWVFALLTAKFGLPAVGESQVAEMASYVVAAVFVVVAMFWSNKKDKKNKALPPE